MATNESEQPISFKDFEPMARFAVGPATYSPHMRQYGAECILHGARGWGYGKDKPAAQWHAIRSCYKYYRQELWRASTMAQLEPQLMAAKRRLVDILHTNGAALTRFNVSWNQRDTRASMFHRDRFRPWVVQISIDYDIDLHRQDGAKQRGGALFMALPSEFIAQLNKTIDEIGARDFVTIRYVAKHELHLSILSKMRRVKWDALPTISITEAKPGDVLCEVYARYFFQVASISKTGSKIMIHEFWDKRGPTPLVRLKKDEIETSYKRLTYGEICRWMGCKDRLELVKKAIQAKEELIK